MQIVWNNHHTLKNVSLDMVLYEVRRDDPDNPLLLDSVTMIDVMQDADEVLTFDALVSTFVKLDRKMDILKRIMERTSSEIKPVAVQISEPFKQRGVAQIAVIYELSDGQTVTIFFHNPDVDPRKIQQSDELVSWKWLLNKKDITIVVAPERGQDINVNVVAQRIMALAEKNSPAFKRANAKRAEKLQEIEGLKTEITGLETELANAEHELEIVEQEYEDWQESERRKADSMQRMIDESQNRSISVKKALTDLGWKLSPDGVAMVKGSGAAIYQDDQKTLSGGIWRVYRLKRDNWSKIIDIDDKRDNYHKVSVKAMAFRINDAATSSRALDSIIDEQSTFDAVYLQSILDGPDAFLGSKMLTLFRLNKIYYRNTEQRGVRNLLKQALLKVEQQNSAHPVKVA